MAGFKRVKPPTGKITNRKKLSLARKAYQSKKAKKMYEKAKRDSFGFTVIKDRKGTVTEQKI